MANFIVFFLNGPNLNRLGAREPEIYGADRLEDIEKTCLDDAQTLGIELVCRQTNSEGELVDWIQEASEKADGLILNPGGYTHTSVAILDALRAADISKIEVHLSNIHGREPFRQTSVTAAGVDGVIAGLGPVGYQLALKALSETLEARKKD